MGFTPRESEANAERQGVEAVAPRKGIAGGSAPVTAPASAPLPRRAQTLHELQEGRGTHVISSRALFPEVASPPLTSKDEQGVVLPVAESPGAGRDKIGADGVDKQTFPAFPLSRQAHDRAAAAEDMAGDHRSPSAAARERALDAANILTRTPPECHDALFRNYLAAPMVVVSAGGGDVGDGTGGGRLRASVSPVSSQPGSANLSVYSRMRPPPAHKHALIQKRTPVQVSSDAEMRSPTRLTSSPSPPAISLSPHPADDESSYVRAVGLAAGPGPAPMNNTSRKGAEYRDALSLSQDPAQLSMVLGGGLGRSKLADKLPSRLMGLARQISQVCKQ